MAKLLVLTFLIVLGSSLISCAVANSAADNVRIAYLFSIDSQESMPVVFRMLSMFYSDEDTFVIHVNSALDKSVLASVDNYTRTLKAPSADDNIIIISTQLVHYGGISQIEAHFDMMWYALKSDREWDTALPLNGDVYPLAKRTEIKRRLTLLKGKNLLHNDGTWGIDSPVLKTSRLKRFYIETTDGLHLIERAKGQRRLPNNLEFRFGSPVVALTRRFCEALMSGDVARNMLLLFSTTLHPIEMYYQTVLFNMKEFEGSTLNQLVPESVLYFAESNAYDAPFLTEEKIGDAFYSGAMFAGRIDPQKKEILDKVDERINL